MKAVTLPALFLAALVAGTAHAGMLEPGSAMPAFALADHNDQMVRSQDLAGKSYLLWFYPKAMTPGCTKEAQGIRERYAELQSAGVEVLGVSFDDPASNRRFVETESLPFRLLSDVDRKLAVAVGAADTAEAKFARRISYLVGPDGNVRKAYDDVDPSTHAAGVLADCAEAAGSVPTP